MTALADMGACYRWVRAFVPGPNDYDEFGLRQFRSCEFEQPNGDCCHVALTDENHGTEHTFAGKDLQAAFVKAGTWARRQLAKEAARKKRERQRAAKNRKGGAR